MTFLDAHEAIWLVNFALPLKGFASFTPSKLRLAFPHEAQNFLSHMTSRCELFILKTESNIELLSVFFVGMIGVIGIIGMMGVMGIMRLSERKGCLQTIPSRSNEKTAKQD